MLREVLHLNRAIQNSSMWFPLAKKLAGGAEWNVCFPATHILSLYIGLLNGIHTDLPEP